MSGILAAAQSSGCCCRPQEGCTCSDPNRPGAIIDRGLSSVLVTSGFNIDEARRSNYSPFDCLGCPCTGFAVYGPYGYQAVGSIIDPDFAEGECEGRGCTNGPCPSAPAYSCSAEVGEVVAYQESVSAYVRWRSRLTFLGENKVGQWTWTPQRLPWCQAFNSPQVRVRRFFPFVYSNTGEQAGDVIGDPAGAFINVNTGEYASTPYGDTIGRIIAVADVEVNGVGLTPGDQCSYYAAVSIRYVSEWMLRRFFAEPFFVPFFIESYSATYRKPCVAPTDTVIGTYQLVYDPQYDKYEQDQSCGAIAGFHEVRQTLPQTLTIA